MSSEGATRSSVAASANSTAHTHGTSHSRLNPPKGLGRLDERADASHYESNAHRRQQDKSDLSLDFIAGHRAGGTPHSDTLAQRRNVATPSNINVEDSRKYGTHVYRVGTVPASSHPLTSYHKHEGSPLDEEMSSLYSQDAQNFAPEAGTPFLGGDTVSQKIENVMHSYKVWAAPAGAAQASSMHLRASSPVRQSVGRTRGQSPSRKTDAKARADTLKRSEAPATVYSPLMTYFASEGFPVQKVGGKTMIGHQGWLERPAAGDTTQVDQQKKDFSPKKLGLLDSIKKMAKDMVRHHCLLPLL